MANCHHIGFQSRVQHNGISFFLLLLWDWLNCIKFSLLLWKAIILRLLINLP